MKWVKPKLNDRGDTLVEVVIAMAILTLVLVGAFSAAELGFKQGQNARDRAIILAAIQQQVDALRSFRDSHTWQQFVYGDSNLPSNACNVSGPTHYCGISVRWDHDCDPTTPGFQVCMKMVLRTIVEDGVSVREWVPVNGAINLSIPGGQITLSSVDADPGPASSTGVHYYRFTTGGGASKIGEDGIGASDRNSVNGFFILTELDSLR